MSIEVIHKLLNMNHNTFTKVSTTKKQAGLFTAILLTAGLTLAGCTTDQNDSASTATETTQSTTTTETSSSASDSSATIAAAVEAAEAFMNTLSDEQKATLIGDYNDDSKTTSWTNFPVTFVERAGLNLADLNDEQKTAALKVLEALLNDEAYERVEAIMGGDQFLNDNSSSTEESLGEYYIAFFGEPSTTGEWMLQFGGHHLGMNASINGSTNEITFAPTHLGTQPLTYTDANGNEVSALMDIYEDAFAFYNSLDSDQQQALYQSENVQDLQCAPGDTCDYPTGTGLKGSELTEEQKELLLNLIDNYSGMSDEASATAQREKIAATLDDTYISWSGATEFDTNTGNGIYFLISGPNVYVEFASQNGSAGADVDGYITSGWGHVHSIYRDPTNDYAGSATQQEASGPGGGAGGPGGSGAPSGGPGGAGGPGSNG